MLAQLISSTVITRTARPHCARKPKHVTAGELIFCLLPYLPCHQSLCTLTKRSVVAMLSSDFLVARFTALYDYFHVSKKRNHLGFTGTNTLDNARYYVPSSPFTADFLFTRSQVVHPHRVMLLRCTNPGD